jgi:hypothetical protein
MSGALPLLSVYGFMAWTGTTLALLSEIVTHTISQSSDSKMLQLWQPQLRCFIYNLI